MPSMHEGGKPTILKPDLCIIGGGAAGSALALAGAALGLSCVIVDMRAVLGRGQAADVALDMLIAEAHARRHRGLRDDQAQNAFAALRRRIGAALEGSMPNGSAERLGSLGATVIEATARFVDGQTVVAGRTTIQARRFVLATGGKPLRPTIAGMDLIRPLTPDTIAGLAVLPERLAVMGNTAAAYELAQAFRLLGSGVTLIPGTVASAIRDAEMRDRIEAQFRRDGMDLREGCDVASLLPASGAITITLDDPDGTVVEASHLLVASGRRPFTESLGLDRAGIANGPEGLILQHDLRTSNRRIFAIGDVAGPGGGAAAIPVQVGLILRAAFFRQKVRYRPGHVPQVVRTSPALATVGASEAEARAAHRQIRILRWPFAENDRAVAIGETAGEVKVLADPGGRILGAAISGPGATEAIALWSLAIARDVPLDGMASLGVAQPSLADASRRAAVTFVAGRLRGAWVKRTLRLLKVLG